MDPPPTERLRLLVVEALGVTEPVLEANVLARGLPRRPAVLCGCCSVSEGISAGVLGGSALILCGASRFLRFPAVVSDAKDAID